MRDENIFDAYLAVPDRITQFQVDASKDWDFDNSSLTLSYFGSLLLFRDLTARNYHVHLLTLTSLYHFVPEEEESDDAEADSSGDDDEDSTAAAPRAAAPAVPPVHSDSLDRYLSLSASAASQFDKTEFSQYDNSRVAGSVIWREPLGARASLRPSYAVQLHSYPNLSGISNVENRFALLAGTVPADGGWLTAGVAYGIKAYTSSATYTYTIDGTPGSLGQGHGKGGAGGTAARTRTITLNSPAVSQLVASAELVQKLAEMIRVRAQVQHFGNPSTAARILPQQLNSTVEQEGMLGLFTSQNEIFDDHYGFSGNEVLLGVELTFPGSINAGCTADFVAKKYTIPARDLSDSLVLAANREDNRLDVAMSLSKSISFGGTRSLKPKAEIHYLRNHSNAPYYEFDKSTYLIGVEYNF
jgi:hypothetical protein